ncbi:sigma factor-like helix-turn-helix DNA-binding protein [Vreelandella aquamarina]|uniref:sigma factor-like helix-turn-helix DNA-binding protein n=1 Tax=Halomonadaceae TaxID=28256 RepID=UPI001D175AB1|nr:MULTISPECIES: sigma factor-like helix-turn-helix DNA-binding protein [Halomonas]MCC4289635.1 helix-turn-helix domain-containing protein [Halomonas axialensis]MCF2913766.1 helix-turn-helix domain-containing protein [Halomonas sp. Cn5-12]|tara:strand:- start:810 stop:1712 length:903 start_codon:yes stop_codon:yes gene_type:complete
MTDLFYDKKVDSRMTTFRSPIHQSLEVEGCSPKMANAIESFYASVTPSYTLRSRRYSLVSLVAKHLDDAAESSMSRLSSRLSPNFSFSQHLKYTGCDNLIKILKFLSHQNRMTPELITDIDNLRKVLIFIKNRNASYSTAKKTHLLENPFCQLCWRYTIAYERYLNSGETEASNAKYCKEHSPSLNPSIYRNDHRYREAFEEWIVTLGGEKEFSLTSDLEKQKAIRKKAFSFSHAKLNERRKKILKLYAAGLSQRKIAEQLGITPQAVSKSLFKLRGYFSTWAQVALDQDLANMSNKKNQ